jgi:peptidoglycan/LPS O-acetylase OafA/YrhL
VNDLSNLFEFALLGCGAFAVAIGAGFYRAPKGPHERRQGAIAMTAGLLALAIGVLAQVRAVPSTWAFVVGAAIIVCIYAAVGWDFARKRDWLSAAAQISLCTIVIEGLLRTLHQPEPPAMHGIVLAFTILVSACVAVSIAKTIQRKRSRRSAS